MSVKSLPHDHSGLSVRLQGEMPSSLPLRDAAELFHLLGEEKRMGIFWLLCHCEECVVDLAALFDLTSSTLSHHLKVLKKAGLVVSRKKGKEVYYSAAETRRAKILHGMIEEMIEMTCPSGDTEQVRPIDKEGVELAEVVRREIAACPASSETVEHIAARYHVSVTALKHSFKRVTGMPIGAYRREQRIKRAMELIRSSEMTLAEIAAAVGYAGQSKLTIAFKEHVGMLPREYRRCVRNESDSDGSM